MTTLERIKNLCKEKEMNITSLENECGFSQNSIVKWAKTSPSADRIICVAKFFNVSTDYLLCLTDDPTPLKTANITDRPTATLSTILAQLSDDTDFVNSAKLYNVVNIEYKKQICTYILGIATALGVNVAQVLGK